MKNVLIIIKKEIKDTLKNRAVFMQFAIFPVLTLINHVYGNGTAYIVCSHYI